MNQPKIRVNDSLLDVAKHYWQAGFSLIPCQLDKRPRIAWQAYSQVRPTEAQLQEWFSDLESQSIGLILGSVSNNIVAIDLDGIAAIQQFYAQFPDLCQNTYSVLTGSQRGLHLYCRVDELPNNLNVRVENVGGFELRGNGQYVIVPPSPHPSGNCYSVYRDQAIVHLPNLNNVSDWLCSLREQSQLQQETSIEESAMPVPVDAQSHKQAYLERVVSQELARVQTASEGNRNQALFYAGLRLANLAAGGELQWGEMTAYLLEAARSVGTPVAEAERTINSAWRIGSKRPRRVR
ncbi:MAG: bifunctional DNA primase/polymerase [Chloroflexota bacterium]